MMKREDPYEEFPNARPIDPVEAARLLRDATFHTQEKLKEKTDLHAKWQQAQREFTDAEYAQREAQQRMLVSALNIKDSE